LDFLFPSPGSGIILKDLDREGSHLAGHQRSGIGALVGEDMKKVAWILGISWVGLAVTMVFFYPFKHPLREELGSASVVIEPILMFHPFGVLWMIYQTIRYEAKPLPYVFLALFVPFAWVWYYFERVRLRKVDGARLTR